MNSRKVMKMVEHTPLTDLEKRALLAVIKTVSSEPLREFLLKQAEALVVVSRKNDRPWGFYTSFASLDDSSFPASDLMLNKPPALTWGIYDPNPDTPGIIFLIYMKDGQIDFLEASTCIAEWPEHEESIVFPDSMPEAVWHIDP